MDEDAISGKTKYDPFIIHGLSLEKINKTFDLMHERIFILTVIYFGE